MEIRPVTFGGQWKYLTFINLWVQLLYFILCLITDFSKERSIIVRWRDVMFASAAFPVGLFVCVSFWGIWAVDRELVFPAKLDPYFPALMNHAMHTVPLPLLLLEMICIHHVYPSRKTGGGIAASFFLAYLIWVHVVFYFGGIWP